MISDYISHIITALGTGWAGWFFGGRQSNNLESTSTTSALTAYQGKLLNDKIGDINTILKSIVGGESNGNN